VQRTAGDKADRAIQWLDVQSDKFDQSLYLLTADTTVALEDLVLGKPADERDAERILRLLSGKTHLVHSAVVLARGNSRWKALSTSKVTFAVLSDADIESYIASHEPFGKAGAYGIQGLAAQFISKLDGSYTGVMGLPLYETAALLKQAGVI